MMTKRATLLLFALSVLQGCNATSQTEGIAPSAGNAVRNNIVAHVVDPWPPESSQHAIGFDARYIIQNNTRPTDPAPAR